MAKKTEELKPKKNNKKIKKEDKTKKDIIKKISEKKSPKKQKPANKARKITAISKRNIKQLRKKKEVIKFQTEYYDLPHKYDKTIVTVLSQTPTTLFVYWEMSDDTQNQFKKMYGNDFFTVTKPILIVYNDTLNYSFEIEINDFANSWYIHINDPDCNYRVELGRRPLPIANQHVENKEDKNSEQPYIPYYVYISSSNNMTSPNDKILFKFNQNITFRNVKNGNTFEKNIQDFKFITNLGIYEFNELYKILYSDEDLHQKGTLLDNPSSGGTSSSIIKKGVI